MKSFDLFDFVGDVSKIFYDDKNMIIIFICNDDCKLSLNYDNKVSYYKLKIFLKDFLK